ncbi:helix-hairpin-helix domain-containing protein [Streptomyces sp. NPDC059695]|uniref:helix-hairpin-helix domain-containing protein n=1 Tax=Streptomyces sp. NPDC059695 TaxID=3346910 RepID=UPI0036C7A280
MTLRSRIASTTPRTSGTPGGPTSGPGRAPGSDGRGRPGGRGSPHGRARRRARVVRAALAPGGAVRRRGDALFPTAAPPVPPVVPPPVRAPEVRRELPEAPERGSPPGVRERLAALLRDRTPVWVQTRCGLEPRALGALTVVLLVAAVVAGAYFWTGRPEAVRAPELVRAAAPVAPETAVPAPGAGSGAGSGAGAGAGVPGGPGAGASAGALVVVDIGGKVRRPGVLTLPAGSRVADALRAAGGAEPGADLTGVNRARVLFDGEQVLVGVPGAPGSPAGGSGPGGGSGGGAPGVPLSLSTATAEQLDGLPGVGPVLAQHIVDHRTEHGGFRSVGELREVDGIGERRFADLEPLVRP